MKAFTNFLAAFALLSNIQPALAQTINPPKQEISLAGSPFAVTTTPDGRYVFASLSSAANGIAVIKQEHTSATLMRVLATGGGTYGLIVTPDGRYLLDTVQPIGSATTPQGVQLIDVQKAIAGQADAILGTVPTGADSGPIEVGLSNDDRFVFVSNEDNETVSVIDFRKALVSGESASSIVGTIPVEQLPVGLAFSANGRYLYITNEEANPTDAGYSATACNIPNGIGGTVSILDYDKALTGGGDSATLGTFTAGEFPRQWALSPDRQHLYLTEYSSNILAIFSVPALIKELDLPRRPPVK